MTSKNVVVTPELALEWVTNYNYPKQRTVRQWWVAHLAEEMKAGNFSQDTAITFAWCGGKKYLVNGQHTLYAIVESERPTALTVIDTIAKDEGELASIYARFDTGLRRNTFDSDKAFDIAEKTGLDRTSLNAFSGGLTIIDSGFNYSMNSRTSPDRRRDLIIEWCPFMHQYIEAIKDGENYKQLRRGGCVSVALMTFRYVPTVAKEFWQAVSQDNGLLIGDPRKALNRFLAQTSVRGGNIRTSKKPITKFQSVLASAKCWNAYHPKIEDMKLLRIPKDNKVVINGTPVGQ